MSVRDLLAGQPSLGLPPAPDEAAPLIYSAAVGTNADLFPQVLRLHVPPGARILDLTYGRGVFWDRVPDGLYEVVAGDAKAGTDFRAMPYPDASFDWAVLDPPYSCFTREGAAGLHGCYATVSRAGYPGTGDGYHQVVLDLYLAGAREARRLLRAGGGLIVKCQDEVQSHRQYLTHVDLAVQLPPLGFRVRDLFVLVQQSPPVRGRIRQQEHARKNHSYFLVFEVAP